MAVGGIGYRYVSKVLATAGGWDDVRREVRGPWGEGRLVSRTRLTKQSRDYARARLTGQASGVGDKLDKQPNTRARKAAGSKHAFVRCTTGKESARTPEPQHIPAFRCITAGRRKLSSSSVGPPSGSKCGAGHPVQTKRRELRTSDAEPESICSRSVTCHARPPKRQRPGRMSNSEGGSVQGARGEGTNQYTES